MRYALLYINFNHR